MASFAGCIWNGFSVQTQFSWGIWKPFQRSRLEGKLTQLSPSVLKPESLVWFWGHFGHISVFLAGTGRFGWTHKLGSGGQAGRQLCFSLRKSTLKGRPPPPLIRPTPDYWICVNWQSMKAGSGWLSIIIWQHAKINWSIKHTSSFHSVPRLH